MNELITNFLNDYYMNPDPQYAVFLKGHWGCGKTHFIKSWLQHYKKCETVEDAVTITLEPIYVSLFGLRTIDDIKTAIDREINPFFYSKTGKVIKCLANLIGKIVLKTNIDINHDRKDDVSLTSGSIDPLTLFHCKEDIVSGKKFIVFDDIERCQVEMKSLLGFINYFVEHCGCHVVVIGDDTKFGDTGKKQLNEFKEKTIGREFTIGPDVEGAVDDFLGEPYMAQYLRMERNYIVKCFSSAGNDNLRILRQCLMDYSSQLAGVDQKLLESVNLFLHGLLGSFVAVYSELNDKDNHETFMNFAKFYQLSVGLDNENGKKLRTLYQKYNDISQGCLYHVLSVLNVHHIVSHIIEGTPLNDYIAKHINDNKKSFASWEKLEDFWGLDNKEFLELYNESMKALLENRIELPYQMGTTIGYIGYIDAVDVKSISKSNKFKLQTNLRKKIGSAKDLEDLYQTRISLIQGINYVRMSDNSVKMPVLDECDSVIQKSFTQKSKSLPNEMQKALRSLSDNNVDTLFEIDDKAYPDKSTSYQQKAIFEQEDVDDLFERICKLSNKGKNVLCSFLAKHYYFSSSTSEIPNYYSSDKKVLVALEKRIKNKTMAATGVDKLAYRRLDDSLLKAISRSKGAKEPLV